jgi:cob(I)alamin adenosyltransferase
MKGYIHIYTGNGKGKTTAALGLALRATGAGMKVFIAQFMKGTDTSEMKSLRKLKDSITVRQYGTDRFIPEKPGPEDIKYAQRGLEEIRDIMSSGKYQVIILDEANTAVHFGLFTARNLLDIMEGKPDEAELVITGRYAHPSVIEKADLVTEMVEVKHYFRCGVQARTGIEK